MVYTDMPIPTEDNQKTSKKDEYINGEKVTDEFYRVLNYLDNSYIKKTCTDIAL